MDIDNDQLFKLLIQNRGIKTGTILRYKAYLELYCNFLGKTPTQLIDDAEKQEDEGLRMRSRNIKKYLLDFKEHLEKNNYSPKTINSTLTIIRSFYNEFEIQLPRMNLRKKYKKEVAEDIPNKKDIRFALKYVNPKYKAIILIISSSGMGSAEVRSLTYGHLLISLKDYLNYPKNTFVSVDDLIQLVEEKEKENIPIVPIWKITRIKTETPIITFSTPESLTAILEYLKIDPPEKLESFLFRSNRKKETELGGIPLSQYFKKLNDKCGFGEPDRQVKFRSHAVGRKYFATTLNDVGIPQLTIDFFLGHSIDDTTEAYIKPKVETLKNHYLKCIKSLSIEDVEVRVLESEDKKRLNELENKYKELEQILIDDGKIEKLPSKK